MEKQGRKIKNRKGFTLIELIVVIAILGILTAVAVPKLTGYQKKAKVSADKTTFSTLNSAVAIAAADGSITSGQVVIAVAEKTGAITVDPSGDLQGSMDLIEPGAAFQLDTNKGHQFIWEVSEGEITNAPAIDKNGKITNGE